VFFFVEFGCTRIGSGSGSGGASPNWLADFGGSGGGEDNESESEIGALTESTFIHMDGMLFDVDTAGIAVIQIVC
jgi:hypothetical protein